MNTQTHKELIAIALSLGLNSVSQYAKFYKKIKQIVKEIKK